MTKKIVTFFTLCMLCVLCAIGFTACNILNSANNKGDNPVSPIPHTHNYVNGVCIDCGEKNSVYIPPKPTSDDYFIFTLLEDNTYEIKAKDVNNLPSEVVLPSTYNGAEIKTIGYMAFARSNKMTNIIVSDSYTTIGEGAFAWCDCLSNIIIPDSITKIDDGAFFDCINLSKILIGKNVETIGNGAFDGCSSLITLTIPDSVKSFGGEAFEECGNLLNVYIGNGLTELYYEAFCGCSNLESITIGNNVTNIKRSAFRGCEKLTNITFNGTKEKWNTVNKESGWNEDFPATVVHCTDGDEDILTIFTQSKAISCIIDIENTSIASPVMVMPTIKELIKTQKCIDKANEIYHNEYDAHGNIDIQAITINNEDTIIMLTYSDSSLDKAANKLDAYIKAIQYTVPSLFEFDIEIIIFEN